MKKMTKKAAALMLAAILAAGASGCKDNSTPASSVSSKSEKTEPVTEKITTVEVTVKEEDTLHETTPLPVTEAPVTEPTETTEGVSSLINVDGQLFRPGVWVAAYENSEAEYYDETYYCFDGKGGGTLLFQSTGTGAGFTYEDIEGEQLKAVFHIGGADVNNYMEIIGIDDDTIRVKWNDNDNAVEIWRYWGRTEDFAFYDNMSLGEMAKFLYGMSQYCPDNMGVDTYISPLDGFVKILIFDADDTDGMRSREILYTISRYTGKGIAQPYKENGVPAECDTYEVDLTMFRDTWDEMPLMNRFMKEPYKKLREELDTEGALFGFWYLGYIDYDINDLDNFRPLLTRAFNMKGYSEKIYTLPTFPSEQFVHTDDGTELYFILPSDDVTSVTVTKQELTDEGTLRETEILYAKDGSNEPFLLKCNVSEIYPDVVVKMSGTGGKVTEWSPYVSGRDGTVPTDNDSGTVIHDFSEYNNLISAEDLKAQG